MSAHSEPKRDGAELGQPIFIVGCPRSGTTYVQSILAAHPDVVSFPETHFFRALGNRWRARLGLASIKGRERRALIAFLDVIDRPDLQPFVPRTTLRASRYVAALRQILNNLARENGASCWAEKTPDHLHYIQQIRRYIPSARFVHVVRNGADTIASLYDVVSKHGTAWGGPYDLDWFIDRWGTDVARTAAWVNRPNHFVVRYETLLVQPAAVERLMTQLRLPVFELDEASRQAAAQTLLNAAEPWKQMIVQPAAAVAKRKFEQVFSESQQMYVREHLQPLPAAFRLASE